MPINDSIPLKAGPINLSYTDGELRYLRIGGREILRRVYVAVRDRWWNTIPLHLTNLQSHIADDHFHLTFTATHQQGEIDFAWEGAISGAADGTITLTMEGVARSTFWRNRIGLCVLHLPIEAACEVEHTDGRRTVGCFPRFIAPHQPFKDIRAITHEVVPGLRAEVRLEGDTFEMEDQRNWTDGSFKTYSTPLELPFPVEVAAGTRVQQSFTLRLIGTVTLPLSEPLQIAAPEAVRLTLSHSLIGKLPQLGLNIAGHEQRLSAGEIARLRVLNLSHLRLDLRLSDSDYESRLERAVSEARALDVKLEAALFISDMAEAQLQALAEAVRRIHPPVVRWLIFHQAEKVTSAKWLALARQLLPNADGKAVFGAGTNEYFAELNRHRPQYGALADVICYSINPQVHAFDNISLVETLEVQAATIENSRRFLGNVALAVTPVTLKPRFNPHTISEAAINAPGRLPASVDVRQMSLFGAAWTAGSLKYLTESGAASLTYYETTGWRGVMETITGSPVPGLFASVPGRVFPLYHVLADAGEFADGNILSLTSGDPLKVIGLALSAGVRIRLILANLSGITQRVRISGISTPVQIRRLNEMSLDEAASSPELFRAAVHPMLVPQNGELELTLNPDETITLDSTDNQSQEACT